MGGSASTTWDRYVPTPPPGEDRNDDQRQQQAKSNSSDTKAKQQAKSNKNEEKGKPNKNDDKAKANQQTKANAEDGKTRQQTNPKANDVKEEQQTKSNKTNEKEKKQSKSKDGDAKQEQHNKEKQTSSNKDNRRKDKQIKANTENIEEIERTKSARNEGMKRPQMKYGFEHKIFDDEAEYDPMANFLEKKDLDKDWGKVTDDVYTDDVSSRSMARKKPLGPRWKPKTAIGNENVMGYLPLSSNSDSKYKSKQFSDKNVGLSAGPVSRPKMKIGYEYKLDKSNQDQYSLHGNFVLDPVKTNGNFIT